MDTSDADKRYAGPALILMLALTAAQSASAAEKAEYRMTEQSAGSTSTCIHEFKRPDGSWRGIEDSGCSAVFSPDNKRMAYRIVQKDKLALVLYDMETDTISLAMTFFNGTDVGKFVWSPDSSALAFTTVNQDAPDYPTKSKLFIYEVPLKKKVKTDVQAFRSCGAACAASAPVWSPDGKQLNLVEIDRQKMLEGKSPFERDAVFDRNGARLKTSPWR